MAVALESRLPEIKRLYLQGLSAADIAKQFGDIKLTSSIKRLIGDMREGTRSVIISKTEEARRVAPSRTFKAQEAERVYSKLKGEYSQELLNKTDEFTKNSKYKNLSQVENALFKHFRNSKYTAVPALVQSKNAFFRPADKIFNIPENFKIYGGEFGKRKLLEKQTALRQLIGTKFFANSTLPKYDELREAMVKFYGNPETKREDLSATTRNAIRKFNQDFSIATARQAGQTTGIVKNFFDEKGFDFSKKIKDWRKIWTTKEGLQDLLKTPNLSEVDRAFYKRQLDKLNKTDRGLLKALKEKFPAMFKKDAAGGTMQLEHRVARALGETKGMTLPTDYIARASYVPGRFNQAKYKMYDEPLFDLISKYNSGDKSAKSKILKLTEDFNKRSKGFLKNVDFKWGDKVKMTDSTPLFTRRSDMNILRDIGKNIESSQSYFKSLGSERIPGMPRGAVASDFVAASSDVLPLRKLIDSFNKEKYSVQRNVANVLGCGIAEGGRIGYALGTATIKCVNTKLTNEPVQSSMKLRVAEGIGKIKPAATSFLKLLGRGGVKAAPFAALAAVGAGIEPLVKQFVIDDPTTYLTDEGQMKGMLLATIEGETPKVDEEILKWQYPGMAASAAAAIPGSSALMKARKAKGFGTPRAALGPVGKFLAGTFSPLGVAATLPISVAAQRKGGTEWGDIATDPLNWMAPAFASTGARMATRGMAPTGILAKAIRMGISPRTLSLVSRRFGMPGLAVSAGMWGYDKWKNRSINDED